VGAGGTEDHEGVFSTIPQRSGLERDPHLVQGKGDGYENPSFFVRSADHRYENPGKSYIVFAMNTSGDFVLAQEEECRMRGGGTCRN